ncbi:MULTISPECIES: alpha/beta fold hydrolase [unclassified Streptomyces]|uniref:thioesterase II family protein n=1 Tax=unclassified Streptomyces TaxID=2593676 RepID=UPI002E80A7E8|nr:alpha/beta fold hydrolase [Streptomyces sp. NBC_00589]WTI37342.1 alpha/beta fold hydrolase [Streptomyces sp. NBC_00775]WUB28981.1 alpha/beta fold hydrolase [Streptomyces sp. NBC_00589]
MDNWIRRFHPAPGARMRLLCFPHAGGTAGSYHALSASVEGAVEPLIVQYPGRLDRFAEPFAERLDDVVDAVLDELDADDRPLALFGHSMGALLAFATARRLETEGRAPAVLFVSGREGPSLPVRTRLPQSPSDDELLAELRLLSGTAAELLDSPEFLQLVLPPLRADYRMLAAYACPPGPPLGCPVVALTGDSDPRVSVDGVGAWEGETDGPFTRHVLPGGHFYLDDHRTYVADVITSVCGSAVSAV